MKFALVFFLILPFKIFSQELNIEGEWRNCKIRSGKVDTSFNVCPTFTITENRIKILFGKNKTEFYTYKIIGDNIEINKVNGTWLRSGKLLVRLGKYKDSIQLELVDIKTNRIFLLYK